jgi:hypothetical protein
MKVYDHKNRLIRCDRCKNDEFIFISETPQTYVLMQTTFIKHLFACAKCNAELSFTTCDLSTKPVDNIVENNVKVLKDKHGKTSD